MPMIAPRCSTLLALGLVACGSASGSGGGGPDATPQGARTLAVSTGASFVLRAGASVDVAVEVVREGAWQGDVEISIAGLPSGASASALALGVDESDGIIVVSATDEVATGLRGSMELVASGEGLVATTHAELLTIGQAGTLDTSFGGPSGAATSFATGLDAGNDALALPDGGVLVGGTSSLSGGYAVLHRRRADGALDPGFGDDGVVRLQTTDGSPCDLERLDDGRTLVYLQEQDNARVLALLPDGSLDPTLDFDALRACEEGGLLVQGDGRIVIVGQDEDGMAVERRLPDGAYDPAFAVDGHLDVDLGAVAIGHLNWPVALADGALLVAARFIADSDWGTGLVRITAGGEVDTGYGTDGLLTMGSVNDYLRGLLRESGDRLLGVIFDGGVTTTLSWVDGGGGLLQPPASHSFEQAGSYAYDTAMDVAGRSYSVYTEMGSCFVLRHTSAGTLDATFGVDGIATVEILNDGICQGIGLEDGVRAVLTGRDRSAPGGEVRTWVAQIWL